MTLEVLLSLSSFYIEVVLRDKGGRSGQSIKNKNQVLILKSEGEGKSLSFDMSTSLNKIDVFDLTSVGK